jgi:large subunit ribosomal protein L25
MQLKTRVEHGSKIRKSGFIPGVVYGHNFETAKVQVPYHEFKQALLKYGKTKSFDATLDGKKIVVYIKDAQYEFLKQNDYIHFDLVKVVKGDTLQANVKLHFINKNKLPGSLVFTTALDEIYIEYGVGSGVAYIDVDVSGLTEFEPLHVKDIVLPKGIKVLTDKDAVICTLQQGSSAELPEEKEEVVVSETTFE